jgi:L-iditol 2-dehydrogenase
MIVQRSTMRSAILVEPKRIELRGVPMPQPAPGAIVVRVRAALTDGTDLKAYRRGHPQMPMPTPFGHEFSGDVAAVGEGVTKFSVGEPVMSVHSAPCGACYWCERGEEELCESVMATKILGAYAEYIEIPKHIVEQNCYRKPPDLSYACAAFLEPLSCVVHSLEFAQIPPESAVLVMGDGGFGLLHAALLARAGKRPILAGRRAERMKIARGFGVRETIDARNEDVMQRVRELTGGRGADALIECTGREEVWEAAPMMVRRGGIVSFFGGLPSTARVSFLAARVHYDEVKLVSPFHFTPQAVKRAYDLLAAREIDPAALVSASVQLDRIADVFERLDAGEGIKFAIQP